MIAIITIRSGHPTSRSGHRRVARKRRLLSRPGKSSLVLRFARRSGSSATGVRGLFGQAGVPRLFPRNCVRGWRFGCMGRAMVRGREGAMSPMQERVPQGTLSSGWQAMRELRPANLRTVRERQYARLSGCGEEARPLRRVSDQKEAPENQNRQKSGLNPATM